MAHEDSFILVRVITAEFEAIMNDKSVWNASVECGRSTKLHGVYAVS